MKDLKSKIKEFVSNKINQNPIGQSTMEEAKGIAIITIEFMLENYDIKPKTNKEKDKQ